MQWQTICICIIYIHVCIYNKIMFNSNQKIFISLKWHNCVIKIILQSKSFKTVNSLSDYLKFNRWVDWMDIEFFHVNSYLYFICQYIIYKTYQNLCTVYKYRNFFIHTISIIINMTIPCDMTVKYWFPLTTNAFTSILFPLRMETRENKFCRCQLFLKKDYEIMTDPRLIKTSMTSERKCTYNNLACKSLLLKWIEYSCTYKNIPLPKHKSIFS